MLGQNAVRPIACTVLRAAIAITCLGTAARWLPVDSPLFAFLYYDHDLLGERAAALVDDTLLSVIALAGVLILTPLARGAAMIAAVANFVLALATAMTATRQGALVPLEDAVRYLAPLALPLMMRGSVPAGRHAEHSIAAATLLAVASAATFIGHGLAAWATTPHFVDLILSVGHKTIAADMSQSAAEAWLRVIAVADVTAALLLLLTHNRGVAGWMVVWGLLTASARLVYGGSALWPDAAIRALNSGTPAALLLMTSRTKGSSSLRRAGAFAMSLLIAALLPTCGSKSSLSDDEFRPGPRQWRVVWTEDPAHAALIAWSTIDAGREHRVLIDTQPIGAGGRTGLRTITAQLNAPYSRRNADDGPSLHLHHAHVDALQPSTTYWFVIDSDGLRSPLFHFVTAPADDRPFTLLAGSDSRSDRAQRRVMNRRIRAQMEADPEALALLHGGDYVYDGTNFDLFSEWLTDQELVVAADGRILPIIPTRGNHEGVGKLFDEAFGWPGGGMGRNWYPCLLAPNVLIVVLNTEVPTAGDQTQFLEGTLAAAGHVRWLLASYHQPAWPSVKLPSSALLDFVPRFEQYDVDLVVESDGHTLKRTVPIRAGKQDPTGVTYIGEGGLGVAQRTPDAKRWFLAPPGFTRSAHHIWSLHITPETIRMRAILEDGTVADDTEIRARRRG